MLIKRDLQNGEKNQDFFSSTIYETVFRSKDIQKLKIKDYKRIRPANINSKRVRWHCINFIENEV